MATNPRRMECPHSFPALPSMRMTPPRATIPPPPERPASIPRLAVDENAPAPHPGAAAPIAAADEMPRVTANADPPARHLGPDPVAGVSMIAGTVFLFGKSGIRAG